MRAQFGRSMIEMLGVLAIIGVVSIGGISLYRRAIDTHKANSIFDDVNRFEFVISERIERTPRGFFDKADFVPTCGFEMNGFNEPELDSHYISVHDVPKSVCRIVLDKGEGKYVMFANNLIYEGDSSICRGDVLNEMRFYFGDTSDLCSFPAPGENSCSDGCLCPEGNHCETDVYNPNWPNAKPSGQETLSACCPGVESTDPNEAACNGKCVNMACGENMEFNKKDCVCACTDPDTMEYTSDLSKCVCKKDANGVQLVIKNGKCVCPTAGYTLVDGACTRIYCRAGTSGNTYGCFINDLKCGHNCDSTGHGCEMGFCYAEECGSYEWVDIIKDPDNPVTSYTDASYPYLCKKKENDFACYSKFGHLGVWDCYDEKGANCMSISWSTYTGTCDKNECAAFKDSKGNGATLLSTWGLCRFEADDYECYKRGTTWNCFNNGNICGKACADPTNCGTCKNAQKACASGWTWNTTNKRCENADSYCIPSEKTSTFAGYTQICYSKIDESQCGVYTCSFSGTYWHEGSCINPDCSSYQYDNQTMTFGPVTESRWGCVVAGQMKCFEKSTGTTATCYYGSSYCGDECNFVGQNCLRVYKPQCATAGHCPQNGYDMGKAGDLCTCDGAVTSNVSVTVDDGNGGTTTEKHSFCCPANHTYTNGGCTLL